MNAMPDSVEVRNNALHERYEAEFDGVQAFAAYKLHDGAITFTHTSVPHKIAGQGIGSRIVRFALNDARMRGWKVVPRCPFVADYIRRHPEYQDLVAPSA